MHDRASVNTVAMTTISIVYPNLLDIGCMSHTIDHVGDKFLTPVLDEFVTAWVQMFSHSPKSRLLWNSRVGFSVCMLCKTRWWSRWEVIDQLLQVFGDVEPFLVQNDDWAPRTRQKMLSILQDGTKKAYLQIEMAAVVDTGREFVKSTYKLEGDGALVLDCYECLQSVIASIHISNFPNVDAIIREISTDPSTQQQLKLYALSCVNLDWIISCRSIQGT
jgi:hypothetical protein